MLEAWSPIELATERLVLRPPRMADAAAIAEGIGDFAVARMLARVPHPYHRCDAEDWIRRVRWDMANGEGLSLVIVVDGEVGGVVSLSGTPSPSLGYWLASGHWGHGFATEAARAVLRHAFAAEGLRIVRSGVFVDNQASRHVQDKLGFVRLGLSRVRCLARNARVDHIDTALGRERFNEFGA